MGEERQKALLFRAAYFMTFLAQAISYCLFIPFLTSIGYNATERGIVLAAGAVVGAAIQFYVGYLCDKNKTIKRYANYIGIGYLIATFLVYQNSTKNFAFHLIVGGLLIVFYHITVAVYDSWALESGNEIRKQFGVIRAYGSGSWALGSFIASWLVSRFGYGALSYGFAVSNGILLVINLFLKDAIKTLNTEKITLKNMKRMLSNKLYLLAVISIFSVYMVMSAQNAVIDKISLLGGSESDISLMWAIMAVSEMPLFFLGNRAIRYYGADLLFIAGTLLYTVRFVLHGLIDSVNVILLISVMQGLTFTLILLTSKALIDRHVPDNMKSSGQQVAMALYSNTASLIGPILCGALEDAFSPNVAMLVIAGFGVLALGLFSVYHQQCRKQALANGKNPAMGDFS